MKAILLEYFDIESNQHYNNIFLDKYICETQS